VLTSYLKLSLRLLARNPFFTFINVAGLSVGFAVFFILWQYSQSELKSDQIHNDWERIVRQTLKWKDSDSEVVFGIGNPATSKVLSQTLPELSDFVRICSQQNFRSSFTHDHDRELFLSRHLDNGQNLSFQEQKLAYADVNLFEFFSIPLLKGQKTNVLNSPSAIVLSQKLAERYFGNENPLDQVLYINDSVALTVTGVFENLPSNTHLEFEAVMSMNRIENHITNIDFSLDAWFFTYYKLPKGIDAINLEDKITKAVNELNREENEKWGWGNVQMSTHFQPLADVAFSRLRQDNFKSKSKPTLKMFQLVAIVILLLAWINYINLTIASHRKRTKEVAARLALGSQTRQFITQFIVEAGLVNVMAILFSFTLYQLLKTPIQQLFSFSQPVWNAQGISTLLLIGLAVLAGITISGTYPALIILNKSPKSLFSSMKLMTSENNIARVLTITQFIIATVLIVWVFMVNNQVRYVMNKDLGISRNEVVVVDLPFFQSSAFPGELKVFTDQVNKIQGVSDFAISSSVAGDKDPNGIGLQKSPNSLFMGVATNGGVDERFIPFFGVKLLAGRNFQPQNKADENSIIVSRKVAEMMGYKIEEALGQRVLVERAMWTHDMKWLDIVGIIEDYNHQPFLKGFQGYWDNDRGLALTYGSKAEEKNKPRKISLKVDMQDFDKTMGEVKQLYEFTFHGNLFNWAFLNDNVNRHYENEQLISRQIILFTLIAIGIACLGLLGMISNKVVEKTKEIGIRKVLGAQLHQIAQILLSTTAKQIIIATIIGIPVAYYLTQQYLQKFSERIELQWWHFALPVLILVVIMLATVASVLWKAARSNPVEALRTE
jgi:putative ABC transport system permease protein